MPKYWERTLKATEIRSGDLIFHDEINRWLKVSEIEHAIDPESKTIRRVIIRCNCGHVWTLVANDVDNDMLSLQMERMTCAMR